MSGASSVIHKQNKLIRLFNEIGATVPEHAIFIEDFNIRRSYVFERMVSRGVFVECEPGKFFIDNEMVPTFIRSRKNRVFIAMVAVLAVMAVYYLLMGMRL